MHPADGGMSFRKRGKEGCSFLPPENSIHSGEKGDFQLRVGHLPHLNHHC